MSHFAQVEFQGTLELIRSTLNAMGLSYEMHPQGKEMYCNPAWRASNPVLPVAHLIVDQQSFIRRGGTVQQAVASAERMMDVGFVRQENGLYSLVLDHHVMQGNNKRFAQQFVLKYAELAAEQQGYTVVRDAAGNPIIKDAKNGGKTLVVLPPTRAVVRR